MRISDSTTIYTAGEDKYLIDFATASIDRIEPDLAEKVEKLVNEGSFKEQTAPIERKPLLYLKEQDYLTALSPWEEEQRNKRKIEKRRAKAKIGPKRIAILLDPEVGSAWCNSIKEGGSSSSNDIQEENYIEPNLASLEKIPAQLSGEKVDEVDIFFKLERGKNSWEDIYSTVKSKGFSVRRVWTVTDHSEKEEAEAWAQNNLLPQNVTLALKTTNSSLGDYLLVSSEQGTSEKNLFSQRLRSLFEEGSAYFLCPFIYDTVFVTPEKMDYCPAEIGEKRSAGSSLDNGVRGSLFANNSLSKGCEELPKDCEFQPICDSTCRRFTEVFGENENTIEDRFEKTLSTAIDELSLPFLKDQVKTAPGRIEK